MITIDILDRNYAKKLFNGLSSGYKSSTVTDNADGSKTLTITFVNGDKANITFNPVKGDKGEQGLQGNKGDKGDKGDTGLGIKTIEQTTESPSDGGENILTITLTDGTSKSFKILNGSKGSKGDTGISLDDVKLVKDITDKTNHLQVKFDNETSYIDLGRVQGKSNYEIALDNGFVGSEDEYLKSLTAQATESKIVTSKPRIEDDATALGVWYYWQDNKEGTTDTAYKYRLDIPSTQDLEHGKYCFYYNLKWFTSETTQDVKALTNKDTYKYYLVMDLLDVSYDIIQETIADGTTTVLEHVTGDISATTPTSDYTPISSSALSMLGVQCQTLYIGATKETANEVTIRTGTDVKDFITSGSFQSIIGNKSDLSTLNNDNIVSAINEIKSDLDEHTNNSDIHITTAERTKWDKTSTDFTTHTGDTDIHITSDERTKWNEVDNKVNKTDITTTIDGNSTDSQVPSARAVYDNSLTKGLGEGNTIIPDGADLNDYLIPGVYTCFSSVSAETLSNCPHKESNFKLFVNKNTGETTGFYGYQMIVGSKFSTILKPCVYYRNVSGDKSNPTYSKWQKLCTTSVEDVPVTNIVPADTTTFVNFAGNCNYCVKNGVCYVSLWGVKITSTGASKQTGVYLPKSVNGNAGAMMSGVGDGVYHAYAYILQDGNLRFDVKDANINLYVTFSYPVAES